MSDFFEQVKVNAYKTKDEAVKIGKQVIDKANNVMSRTKLNFAINDAENKIKDIYAEIGQKIYSEYLSGNNVIEGLDESCNQIDKLFEEISALKEKMAELKDSLKCSSCGSYNAQGSIFCSSCGAALVGDDASDSSADEENFEEEEENASETVKRVITIKAKRPESDD